MHIRAKMVCAGICLRERRNGWMDHIGEWWHIENVVLTSKDHNRFTMSVNTGFQHWLGEDREVALAAQHGHICPPCLSDLI